MVGAADPEGTHLPLLLAVITWLVPDGRQAVQLDRLPDSHDRPQRDPMHPSRPLDGCAAPARLRQTETACSLRALSRVLCDTLRSVYSSGSRLGAGFRGHATGPGALDSVGSGPGLAGGPLPIQARPTWRIRVCGSEGPLGPDGCSARAVVCAGTGVCPREPGQTGCSMENPAPPLDGGSWHWPLAGIGPGLARHRKRPPSDRDRAATDARPPQGGSSGRARERA